MKTWVGCSISVTKYLITVKKEAFGWAEVLSLEQYGATVYIHKGCGVGLAFVALKRDQQGCKDLEDSIISFFYSVE